MIHSLPLPEMQFLPETTRIKLQNVIAMATRLTFSPAPRGGTLTARIKEGLNCGLSTSCKYAKMSFT